MELGLEIIKTRANLWAIQQRIKTARKQILKTNIDLLQRVKELEMEIQTQSF
jgi:hypothetical protein